MWVLFDIRVNCKLFFFALGREAYLQPVHLIVVQSEEGLAKIRQGANLYGAPLAIIVCADHEKAWVRPFDKKQTGDIDTSILTDHMMLSEFRKMPKIRFCENFLFVRSSITL